MARELILPDREPFIAASIIKTLRQWKKRCDPAPLIIQDEDIDQLRDWAGELLRIWRESAECLERSGIEVVEQPSTIARELAKL